MSIALEHPVLLVLVPLALAALTPLFGIWRHRLAFVVALLGSAATAFLAWSLVGRVSTPGTVTYNIGGWQPPWGIQLRVDVFALVLACAAASAGFVLLLYSCRTLTGDLEGNRLPYYYTLFLLALAAAMGVAISGDVFTMFIFLEMLSMAAYALTAVSGTKTALRAAMSYLLAGVSAGAFLFLGIGFLYSVTGTLDMRLIGHRLQGADTGMLATAVVALIIITLALCVKAALLPLHTWFLEVAVYGEDPATALLSSVVVSVGVFAMLRVLYFVYTPSFNELSVGWEAITGLLGWLGAIAFVYCSARALLSGDVRRLAAYAALSQVGLVTVGIAVPTVRTLSGGVLGLAASAAAVSCLLIACGTLVHVTGYRRLSDLCGSAWRMPVTAVAAVVASLSLVGIPFTANYPVKRLILQGLLDGRRHAFVAALLLGTVLTAGWCLRLACVIFSGRPSGGAVAEAPPMVAFPAVVLAVGSVLIGSLAYLTVPAIEAACRAVLSSGG